MNYPEKAMTRWYWQQVGGTLIEEFLAVRPTASRGRRLLDGVIIKGGEFRIARQSELSIKDKDIIVVQTKAQRLGMNLMGQTLFSAELMRPFMPRSIESVPLCRGDDDVLRPLLEKYENVKVVVCSSGEA